MPITIRYPFVNVAMLKLNESCADRRDVALLAGERHSASTLWIPQLWVSVNAGVTDAAVQTPHDQRQLH